MTTTAERSVVEVLRAARECIRDPERWTTNVLARDACGDSVHPTDDHAVRFCAVGAVHAQAGQDYAPIWYLHQAAGDSSPQVINDAGDHAAVLAMYDRAIGLAEKAAA